MSRERMSVLPKTSFEYPRDSRILMVEEDAESSKEGGLQQCYIRSHPQPVKCEYVYVYVNVMVNVEPTPSTRGGSIRFLFLNWLCISLPPSLPSSPCSLSTDILIQKEKRGRETGVRENTLLSFTGAAAPGGG